MKPITLSLIFLLFVGFSAQAQKKVKERDLKGQWKMVFDLDEDFIEEELEEEDLPWLGKVVAEGVSDMVLNILDEIDLRFEFRDHNKLKIMVEVFGEEEVEYASWHIDSKGALVLDDADHDDDIWLLDNNRLYAYERNNGTLKKQPVYLKRVY